MSPTVTRRALQVPDTIEDALCGLKRGFPSADMVGAAAALLTAMPDGAAAPARVGFSRALTDSGRVYRATGEHSTAEAIRWRITVAPGALQVSRTDPARAERLAERVRSSSRIAADLGATDLLLEEALEAADRAAWAAARIGDYAAAESTAAEADHYAARIAARDRPDGAGMARGRVQVWSRKSRTNMMRTLGQLDYAPLFDGAGVPAMVTLTYPGDWLAVAPDAVTCREHVKAFKRRYLRHYGVPLRGVWKREFQRRGAPHFHVLMVPPRRTVNGLGFIAWASSAWADIVGHPDPEERERHLLRGVDVSYADGLRARDPKRVAAYFSKHGGYSAKEYQNHAPEEWGEASVGRFWGVWGLDKARVTVEVSPVEGIAAARALRRWQRANGFRAQKVVVRKVQTVDRETGEIGFRWRRRKSGTWVGARMGGSAGFAMVNDGAALCSKLAGYLDVVRQDQQDAEIEAWLSSPARARLVDPYAPVEVAAPVPCGLLERVKWGVWRSPGWVGPLPE